MNGMEPIATRERPILVVEDDEDTVTALRMLLEDEGYAAVSAPGVERAIASLERVGPGLVLLDWSLDDGSGEEVLCAAQRTCTPTPVVVITGHTRISRNTSTVADAVLRKPFDVNELLGVVARFYQP